MNQATTLLFAVVAWTIVAAMVALRISGLTFPPGDLVQPVLVCTLLLSAACWYRRMPSFVLCLTSLTVLVAFSAAFAVLTYAVATSGWPLADAALARWDSHAGISAQAIRGWVAQWPALQTASWFIYFSLIPQTILAIAVLGLNNNSALTRFLLQFMLGALVTLACFYFLPALGSCDETVPAYYSGVVKDMTELNAGERTVVSWRGAEGIITFPSFHVVWAVLLSIALGWRWIIALNVLVILSTVPVGMHYAIDIIGGLLVCGLVVPLANRWLCKVDTAVVPARCAVAIASPSERRIADAAG